MHTLINNHSNQSTPEHSRSEAKKFPATPELPLNFWKPKVHYRVHNSTPLVPTLLQSRINPLYAIPFPFLNVSFKNIVPFTSRSLYKVSLADTLYRFLLYSLCVTLKHVSRYTLLSTPLQTFSTFPSNRDKI